MELATTAAALWIQGKNRENASLLKDIPSGWRNSRLPRQKIIFSYLDDEVSVYYKSNRDGSFSVNDNINAKIINWSAKGIDVEINNSRFFSKVTQDKDYLVIHGPWGDVLLKIILSY